MEEKNLQEGYENKPQTEEERRNRKTDDKKEEVDGIEVEDQPKTKPSTEDGGTDKKTMNVLENIKVKY